jgi:hypothetical protein
MDASLAATVTRTDSLMLAQVLLPPSLPLVFIVLRILRAWVLLSRELDESEICPMPSRDIRKQQRFVKS